MPALAADDDDAVVGAALERNQALRVGRDREFEVLAARIELAKALCKRVGAFGELGQQQLEREICRFHASGGVDPRGERERYGCRGHPALERAVGLGERRGEHQAAQTEV